MLFLRSLNFLFSSMIFVFTLSTVVKGRTTGGCSPLSLLLHMDVGEGFCMLVNPRSACAARVTVLGPVLELESSLAVCPSVHASSRTTGYTPGSVTAILIATLASFKKRRFSYNYGVQNLAGDHK